MKRVWIVEALSLSAAIFAGCSRVDEVETVTPEGNEPGVWQVEIVASKGDDSKALTLDGSTLNASWAEGDAVVVKQGGTPVGTLYAQSAGPSTRLTGEVTGSYYRLHFRYSEGPVVETTNSTGQCSIRPVCP